MKKEPAAEVSDTTAAGYRKEADTYSPSPVQKSALAAFHAPQENNPLVLGYDTTI